MKTYNIIIVENDEDEQFFMREGFAATGLFRIICILGNGNELIKCLDELAGDIPDLILSDLNMPGKNGYDIIDEITAHPVYNSIPVMITSTSNAPTIISKCLAKGAADYLVKPETFTAYESYVKNLYRRIEERQVVK